MQRVYDRGDIYQGVYEGWYCPNCADFKTEQELLDGNRCPIHKIALDRVREENYFFRLSAYQERLEQLYAERPDFVLPRDALQRGALVHQAGPRGRLGQPAQAQVGRAGAVGHREQVFYVWFDALLNYYTALSTRARART